MSTSKSSSADKSVGNRSQQRVPYVRYTCETDGVLKQNEFRPLNEPIPANAVYMSQGVYFLSQSQQERMNEYKLRHIEAQNECENDGAVAYQIVAESDALEKGESVSKIVEWLTEFAEEWIGIDDFSFYFSGNRSIHLQSPHYIPHEGIDSLRSLAKRFNKERNAELDTSVYTPKQQFRFVGVTHGETGMKKIPIEPNDTRKDCVRKAMGHNSGPTTLHDSLELESSTVTSHPTHYTASIDSRESITAEFEGQLVKEYKKGKGEYSTPTEDESEKYATHFSPYANTGNDERSVIVFEQLDGIRTKRHDRTNYVPVGIKYAVGGDGEYVRCNSTTLLKISQRDCDKWEYEPGDTLVMIGGRSRSSCIIEVERKSWWHSAALTLKEDGRDMALEHLFAMGYDVGTPGSSTDESKTIGSSETEAQRIQYQIERGERPPRYYDVLRVSCRLLKIDGWYRAWAWLERILGSQFDEKATHKRLKTFVEHWPESFEHVSVPSELHV